MAVVADAEGATCLAPDGGGLPGLDRQRNALVARSLGLAPTSPAEWVRVATYNLGLVEWGPVHEASTYDRAWAQGLAAAQEWRPPRFRDRAERLAHEAAVLDEWGQAHPAAADGDEHDPEAELELAQMMAGWVDPGRPHTWLPLALSEVECGYCDLPEPAPVHHGGDAPATAVARHFARAVLGKTPLLSLGLSERQTARVRESLSDDIKKYCDVVHPDLRRPLVSRRAAETAEQRGLDLCGQAWHDQPRFDPGRATFHLEHVVPVRALRERCLRLTEESEVMAVLATARTAWILKAEDRELTRRGFRTRRDDPQAAYAAAGIELRTCH